MHTLNYLYKHMGSITTRGLIDSNSQEIFWMDQINETWWSSDLVWLDSIRWPGRGEKGWAQGGTSVVSAKDC